ncbi:NADPH:quinone oxidoreductase family protein [Mumia sp. Pv 4-285]|uniref:NADPH:quinone oxidoreductase family protein n=1 Tax=Mumia qirimensis TaxID=3234852 RepID=UPI00351D7952
MRAVLVTDRTGPSGVRVHDVPEPELQPGHVLVEVKAAGVTFPDLLLTHGRYQEVPDLPFVLGGEFAGVVRKASYGSGHKVGDRVVCSSYRGFAELVSVPSGRVMPLPAEVPYEIGACLPANYLTMVFALLHRGRLQRGERVLVHGASGGVGVAAIQLALALGASQVIAVTSNLPSALDPRVHVVPAESFAAHTDALTVGAGVDVVVDPVGGERLARSLACMSAGGRALVIGFAAGTIPTISVDAALERNIDLVGVGWGSYLEGNPDELHRVWDQLMGLMREDRTIRPVIDRILPLEGAEEALRMLEARQARGRVVLRPSPAATRSHGIADS